MTKAVVFDLDDTLYPEIDYVQSGYHVVASEIEKRYDLQNAQEELLALFSKNRQNVFNRYLKRHGLPMDENAISELLAIYRNHTPDLILSEEVEQTLIYLREKLYKIGIITDGDPSRQYRKIQTLGLEQFVDEIIVTDAIGGEQCRKPHPLAFEILCKIFTIHPEEMVYVGDNPQKDFAVKKFLPITTIQIKSGQGLYNDMAFLYDIASDMKIKSMNELCNLLCGARK